MKKRIRLKKKNKIIMKFNIINITVSLIIILTFLFFLFFNEKIKPKFKSVAYNKSDKLITLMLNETIYNEKQENINVDDVIITTKNNKDEILTIDYKLDIAYIMLKNIIISLQKKIINLENNQLLKIPFFSIYNMPYLTNLAPYMPVKLKLYGIITGSVKTKVKDYGINNALLEVYLVFNVKTQVILPIGVNEVEKKQEVLIASKVIQGKVPSFYNGIVSNESQLMNILVE